MIKFRFEVSKGYLSYLLWKVDYEWRYSPNPRRKKKVNWIKKKINLNKKEKWLGQRIKWLRQIFLSITSNQSIKYGLIHNWSNTTSKWFFWAKNVIFQMFLKILAPIGPFISICIHSLPIRFWLNILILQWFEISSNISIILKINKKKWK